MIHTNSFGLGPMRYPFVLFVSFVAPFDDI